MITQYHEIEKAGAKKLTIRLIHGHELKMGKNKLYALLSTKGD